MRQRQQFATLPGGGVASAFASARLILVLQRQGHPTERSSVLIQRMPMPEYLTTKELAELLRIKERKVYDLAASGAVPCSKATGKLLFPKEAVDLWLAQHSSGPESAAARPLPNVFLGSHDPLLDWALRESRCGIATYFDSSADGLARFAKGEGLASGLHLYDAETDNWNVASVTAACAGKPAVLVEWAKRQRGLIVAPRLKSKITSLADLAGRRIVPRQAEAGAQSLFLQLAQKTALDLDALEFTAPVRNESDAVLAVLEDKADTAFGLATLADQYRLGFAPVIEERFDLIVDRRAWFEPGMQTLLAFCRSKAFQARAAELNGYDISGFGQVHYNGT